MNEHKNDKLRKRASELDMGLNVVYEPHAWSPDGELELFIGSHSGLGLRKAAVEVNRPQVS